MANSPLDFHRRLLQSQHSFGRGKPTLAGFLLRYGRSWEFNEASLAVPQGEKHQCYRNAAMLALDNPEFIYVEGQTIIIPASGEGGIPIDHAWCVNEDGIVAEPTLGDISFVGAYFGVPFSRSYLTKTVQRLRYWGLIEGNRELITGRETDFLADQWKELGIAFDNHSGLLCTGDSSHQSAEGMNGAIEAVPSSAGS